MAHYKGTSPSSIGLNRRNERMVSATLSSQEAQALEQLSVTRGVSTASLVRTLLRAYIAAHRRERFTEQPA